MLRFFKWLLVCMVIFVIIICSWIAIVFNSIQEADEAVVANWSEVVNQYQRRYDLIPNLMNTVKGYAKQEEAVLVKVTEARAKVGSMQINANQLSDPEAMGRFEGAQNNLRGSLSRLMMVAERYPDLKSQPLFSSLMHQLEGTENRIAVARNRFIDSVKKYNVIIRSFPGYMVAAYMDYKPKVNFSKAENTTISAENEEKVTEAPEVSF